MIERLRKRMMLGILVGVAVVGALVMLSDATALSSAIQDFNWWLLPPVLALTLVNYALRFVKWEYYLRLLDVRDLSRRDSLLIFVSGFSMVMVPGKIGELLKSYLLKVRCDAPMARTAPVVFAERFTDGLALLVLTGIGLTVFQFGWQVFVVGAVLSVGVVMLLQREELVHQILRRLRRSRLGSRRTNALIQLYDSTRTLMRPRPLLVALAISVISWLGECLALFLILVGLDLPATWTLAFAAIFVFSASGWIGGISMLPGGLGAAELSSAALLLLTIDHPQMTSTVAATATLLIRFATLWFGMILGLITLTHVARWTHTVSWTDVEPSWPTETVTR